MTFILQNHHTRNRTGTNRNDFFVVFRYTIRVENFAVFVS